MINKRIHGELPADYRTILEMNEFIQAYPKVHPELLTKNLMVKFKLPGHAYRMALLYVLFIRDAIDTFNQIHQN